MSDKFQNKYRIASTRLQNWDYGWEAAYFVTICTADRQHFLGEIENEKMNLSHQGILVDIFWHEIKNHSKNVELGAFVVMPNHIHGIIILNNNNDNDDTDNNGNNVETRHALSLQSKQSEQPLPQKTIGQQRFQNQGKNTLSSIIGSYKSVVTKHANRLQLPFAWQSRFHEHIIRDDEEYKRIENYIINNPLKWIDDIFFHN